MRKKKGVIFSPFSITSSPVLKRIASSSSSYILWSCCLSSSIEVSSSSSFSAFAYISSSLSFSFLWARALAFPKCIAVSLILYLQNSHCAVLSLKGCFLTSSIQSSITFLYSVSFNIASLCRHSPGPPIGSLPRINLIPRSLWSDDGTGTISVSRVLSSSCFEHRT